jgi:fatty acid-binding protein DegV
VWAYKEAMTPVLEDGRDILCMSFSFRAEQHLSAACVAAQELREAFPQRSILVVDTLAASLGQGHADLLCGEGKAKRQKA